MRVYTITSGIIFGLITVAHLLRIAAEGRHLAAEPLFLVLTLLSASLCAWALALVVRNR